MNKVQYSESFKAPFHSDGWGINDAEGQRIARVNESLAKELPNEHTVLTRLFASAPEMQNALEEVHFMLGLKRNKTVREQEVFAKVSEALKASNKDYV